MPDVYLTISGGPQQQEPPVYDPNEFAKPPAPPVTDSGGDVPVYDPNEFAAAPPQTILPPPEDPNWYTRAWDTAASYIPQSVQDAWKTVNEPLTTLPSRAAKSVSDWMESVPITQETGQGGIGDFLAHTNAQARGLLQGTAEGLGQMGDAFTSPLGIATFGAGGAEKFGATRGLQSVADLANSISKTGGLAFGAHGAQTIANPRTSLGEKAMAVPELAGGATPFFHEPMPVRKPSTVKPKIEPVSGTTTELPKQSKNTTEPPKPTSKPLEPGSQEAKDLSDEIAAAHKKGYAVIDPKSPIAQSPIIKSKRVVGTLSDGSLVIDPKATAPEVPINTKQATNLTPEQLADYELFFKYKKLHESGNMTPEQMTEWAKVYNRIKDLKPNGTFTIRPYRFEPEPEEPPVPGAGLRNDADLFKAQPALTNPRPWDVKPPVAGAEQRGKPFDASTIKYPSGAAPIGIPPAPEGMQFVDPVTGEMRTPEQAKPGDIPLTPGQEPIPPVTEKPRSATKKMNLSSGQTAKPAPEDVVADFRKGLEEPVTQPTGRAAAPTVGKEPKLPAVLRNASTNYRTNKVKFASDLDKAAYIIARTERRSKYDAHYLKFVMDNTGLDEQGARALGRRVKAAVRDAVSNVGDFEDVEMPPTARKMIQEHAAEGANVPPEQRMQDLSNRVQQAADKNLSGEATARELGNAARQSADVIKKAPKEQKANLYRRAVQLQKAWLTAGDIAAPGRQGKAFILNPEWWSSLDDMIKAWGSKEAAHIVNQSIEEHPSGYFRHGENDAGQPTKSFAEKVGLDLAHEEEAFHSQLGQNVRKYGLVDRASRAHTAFLNKLRSDAFARMMSEAKDAGLITNADSEIEFGKKYARFINDATGRGKFRARMQFGDKINIEANDVFFAPKNMAGQIKTWGHILDVRNYGNADPVMRKQTIKTALAVAALGSSMSVLADATGLGKTSYDPTSSDFMKIIAGRTRIDPNGGYQQFPVAVAKAAYLLKTGALSGKKTDYGKQTALDAGTRYLSNRLSPQGRIAFDLLGNKMFNGMPFDLQKEMYEQVAPIAISDIIDVLQENPALAVATAPFTITGLTNTAVYRDRKSGR